MKTPKCTKCGSSDIGFNCVAEFDRETDEFSIVQIMDKRHVCNKCGQTTSVEWVEEAGQLDQIRDAVKEYNEALAKREHGGVAGGEFIGRVIEIVEEKEDAKT